MRLDNDRFLARRISDKTSGGIIIPQLGFAVPYSMYEMVLMGPGMYNFNKDEVIPMEKVVDIKIGDRFLANCGEEREVVVNGETLYLFETIEEVVMILDDGESL